MAHCKPLACQWKWRALITTAVSWPDRASRREEPACDLRPRDRRRCGWYLAEFAARRCAARPIGK
jgi:hypothetical protein